MLESKAQLSLEVLQIAEAAAHMLRSVTAFAFEERMVPFLLPFIDHIPMFLSDLLPCAFTFPNVSVNVMRGSGHGE